MTALIIIRGLPGSGKTTLAGQLVDMFNDLNREGVIDHFEADQFFVNPITGVYEFDYGRLRDAHLWCQEQVRNGLNKGNTVIVSNTFTTMREVKPYMQMIRGHGMEPTIYVCQSDWGSIHNVPDEVVQAMRERFQYDLTNI